MDHDEPLFNLLAGIHFEEEPESDSSDDADSTNDEESVDDSECDSD